MSYIKEKSKKLCSGVFRAEHIILKKSGWVMKTKDFENNLAIVFISTWTESWGERLANWYFDMSDIKYIQDKIKYLSDKALTRNEVIDLLYRFNKDISKVEKNNGSDHANLYIDIK